LFQIALPQLDSLEFADACLTLYLYEELKRSLDSLLLGGGSAVAHGLCEEFVVNVDGWYAWRASDV